MRVAERVALTDAQSYDRMEIMNECDCNYPKTPKHTRGDYECIYFDHIEFDSGIGDDGYYDFGD